MPASRHRASTRRRQPRGTTNSAQTNRRPSHQKRDARTTKGQEENVTKDRRLYAKFDIGMDEHAKIMLLSDAAFRALFESTLYARRQLTDGFLDGRIVARKWSADAVAELTSNDPERPSWIKVDGGYQIHDFAEHQTTTADIEAKREAGRKGGLAKAKQPASKTEAPATEVLEQNVSNSLAKTETETETETLKSVSRAGRKTPLPASWAPNEAHTQYAGDEGINLAFQAERFRTHAEANDRRIVNWDAAFKNWLLKAERTATKPTAASPWSKDFYK
jgi:general stress protein YciG